MRSRRLIGLVALACAMLVLVPATAGAEDPREPEWGTAEVPGAPVDSGLLAGGFLAHGTTDAETLVGGPDGPCQDTETELFLFTVPGGPGCHTAVDVDGTDSDRDGLAALATAERAPRVYAALTGEEGLTGSGADLVAYDLEEGNVTQAFQVSEPGFVPYVDAPARGHRVVAVVQDGQDPEQAAFSLNAYGRDGSRTHGLETLDEVRALDLSDDGRYAAIGGATTVDGERAGWVQVFDLRAGDGADPVVERVLDEGPGRIVESVSVTVDARALAGTQDGTVAAVSPDTDPAFHDAGEGTAYVAASRGGTTFAAASFETLTRLTWNGSDLSERWTRPLNGSATDAVVRGPYVIGVSTVTEAFHRGGEALWTVPGADVLSANRTGLRLGLAQESSRGGASEDVRQTTSVVSAREVHRNLSIRQTDATPDITPGGLVTVNVTLANNGAAVLDGSLVLDGRSPASLDVRPANVTLLPDETRTLNVTVQVGTEARPGTLEIPVRLASTPRTDARGTLTVDVGPTIDLELRPEPGTLTDRAVRQGQNLTLRFLISNAGNTDAQTRVGIQQSPSKGPAWELEARPRGNMTVAAGTTTSIAVDATVPSAAPDGATNRIVVRAGADEGSTAAAVTLTVNPFQALEIRPEKVTKRIAPGTTTAYSFQVGNLGSIPANVTVDASPVDETGDRYVTSAWGVALDRSKVSMDPDQTSTVTLELTAPANDTRNGSIRVQLTAASEEARASAVAFGVADPSLATEDEEPRREPLPWGLAVAGLALAAALGRDP